MAETESKDEGKRRPKHRRAPEAAPAESGSRVSGEPLEAAPPAAKPTAAADGPTLASAAQMPPLPPVIPDLPPAEPPAGMPGLALDAGESGTDALSEAAAPLPTASAAHSVEATRIPTQPLPSEPLSADSWSSPSLAQMPPRPPVIPDVPPVASDQPPSFPPTSSAEPGADAEPARTHTLPAVGTQAEAASSSVATLAAPAPALAAAQASPEAKAEADAHQKAAEPKAHKTPIWVHVTGVIGELLLTAGVLIGLYIGWQLWFSSWEANTMQSEALTEATQEWQEAPPKIGAPRTDPPPESPHVTEMGATIGVIRIPAFGKDWEYLILQGADKAVIDKGYFGHYSDTAYPGEVGNFAMAAHRNTYGAPMHYVDRLKAGDSIIVETDQAYLVYKMYQDPYVVKPTQGDVIWPVPSDQEASANPTRRLLTITTCHPYIGIQIERMITHAEFDHWVARSDGIPQEMADAQ